jgi:adenylosuccinate synthase
VERHLAANRQALGDASWTADRLCQHLLGLAAELEPMLVDGAALLNDQLDRGGSVLLEGAQGTLLDVDQGTYPFVTSSSSTAGGACIGSGIGPTRVRAVIGVTKAYTTRVGNGPFPTELLDPVGETLRKRGAEFGTTTGRPRRCGWLDLVALRYAVRVNGLTRLVITKLDVLDGFDKVKLCTGYRLDGKILDTLPATISALASVEPQYETLEGWRLPAAGVNSWADLPPAAIAYLARVEAVVGAGIGWVSLGAERAATLHKDPLGLDVFAAFA